VTTFESLVGHAQLAARLAGAAAREELNHAILLSGPDSVGKTTTALALAEYLLDARAWPGGLIAHPDLWVEDSDAEWLSIDRVRAGSRAAGPSVQDFLALRPYAGGRRVAVIARADRLTEPASNCLLKTLEEPPPRTHLFLCAAHPDRLPATILSRCETVTLAPVAASTIVTWLRGMPGVDGEAATTAAALSAGRPGRALRLAIDQSALHNEVDALNGFLSIGGTGTAGALRAAAALSPAAGVEGRERAIVILSAWASFVRDASCFAAGAPELAIWSSYRGALERWAEALPAARIVEILGRIADAADGVATNVQPRLAFETLLLDIFAGASSPPAVDVPRRGTGDDAPRSRPRRAART